MLCCGLVRDKNLYFCHVSYLRFVLSQKQFYKSNTTQLKLSRPSFFNKSNTPLKSHGVPRTILTNKKPPTKSCHKSHCNKQMIPILIQTTFVHTILSIVRNKTHRRTKLSLVGTRLRSKPQLNRVSFNGTT